ncbi:hypothetical protein CHS0354_041973 [Potamilus streckersoni]|uniref:SLC26A/SulP transporter domain-containing protein n=1 Tax=Potamilus streckersoni TaxID=2493646 RepID=A0AAE0T9P9_9BIVA|nr:hypothetical protein CHS0354_041973 [Potamilus streckersoni]
MNEENDNMCSSEEKTIEHADYIYRVTAFEKLYRKENNAKRSIFGGTWFNKLNYRSMFKFCKNAYRNTFPFVQVLKNYKVKQDLPSDIISGITVGIMQIPQGMAYSLLASLPAICGLYLSFFAPLIYFFLGSSKHISMGTIAVVSLMVASVLDRRFPPTSSDVQFLPSSNVTENSTTSDTLPYKNDDLVYQKIQFASALSFVSGLVMIAMGKLHLGLVANYMSESMVCGFTSAVVIHVVTAQMKHILGIVIPRHNGAFKIIKVILSTVTSHFGYFKDNYKVKVVGKIPAGIPKPQIPDPTLATDYFGDAVIIGLVAFTQSVSMAQILARKNNYQINPNQEMVAYGAGSILSSIFSGYIPAASVARSLVQEGTGGRTQVSLKLTEYMSQTI